MRTLMRTLSTVLILVATYLVKVASICDKQNQSAELRFTRNLGEEDYVRLDQSIAILCCAEGYDNITWSRMEGDEWTTYPPPPNNDDNAPKLEENKQVLRIYSAKFTDQTSYRCVASKDTQQIEHLTNLTVEECDKLSSGPVITEPVPENQTIYKFGVNVTIYCTGHFGCPNDRNATEQFALWVILNGSFAQNESERYTVETTYTRKEFKKQATLKIASVNEDDLNKTFICVLYAKNKQVYRIVNIKKRDKPDLQSTRTPWLQIGLSVAGGIFVIAFTLVVIAFFRYKYGPQIRLFLSSRIASLGPRLVTKEKYIYNVFIYHADADNEIALSMKKKLNEENYEVFINADTEGNQNILRTFSEKTAQSALVLFLYSEALRNDNLANFLLQSFISERKGKDIMFLELADYKPIEILDWARHAKDKEKIIEKSVEECREVIDDETVEMIRQQELEVVEDLQFWKVLPRLKVPTTGSSERKKRYFWCSLQNRIPKFSGNMIKSVTNCSLEEEKVLIRQENRQNNTRKDEIEGDFIPLTHSRNEDKLITNGAAEINNTDFTPESCIDIPELLSHKSSYDYGREITHNTEGFTIVGATNYAFDKKEDHGHSKPSNQTSSSPGMSDNVIFKSNVSQTNKYGETAKQRNNNLNLIIKMPPSEHGPSSCSPESGYVTSPVEKSSSIGGFLPQIDETTGKAICMEADLHENSKN